MKLGRNELCHCGSGKKYKFCHWDADRAAEAEQRAQEAAARAAEQAATGTEDSNETEPDTSARTAPTGGTGRTPNRDGSRFMRESVKGHQTGKPAGGAGTSRVSRGSQRGS